MRREFLLLVIPVLLFLFLNSAGAEPLSFRRDLISVSEPASGSNHTITFETFTTIPVSGKIVITPQAGAFTIPASLDFTDMDLLVSAVQQTLAATPGTGAGSAVGVSVVSGVSGSITFTLNDTDSIAATIPIEIRVGTNATFGATGDEQITNPSTVGSFDMLFETQDAASAILDERGTVIAIVDRVGLAVVVASATPTPTGFQNRRTTPTPQLFANITFWPTDLPTMTLQTFSASTADVVSTLLSMSTEEFYAVLSLQYPRLLNATGQEFASVLGVSNQQLYDSLVSQYPQLSSLTVAQLSASNVQQLAALAGVSVEEFYAALGLDIQDIATLLGVAVSDLYDFLGVALLDDLRTAPLSAPETTLTTTITDSSGTVQLGVGGDPYSFVTDTASNIGVVTIEDGVWQITTYAQADDAGGQTALSLQVLVLDENGQETLLFSHQITNDLASTPTEYITFTSQPEFTLDPGDRVIVRYFANTSGSTGLVTVTFYFQGNTQYSFIQTPPSIVPSPCFRIADFTGDCLVNLPDLSIMMYNWPTVRNRPDTDLNGDGIVSLVDLSILLFWWTG